VGPIANIDDVKWNLGNLILDPMFQFADLPVVIQSAQQQIEYLDLQCQLAAKMEEGFLAAYFPPLLRQDIKHVIEKMDQVADGPRVAVDRSYENALVLQQSQYDAMGHVSADAGMQPERETEEAVTPDVFPPPGMFCLD